MTDKNTNPNDAYYWMNKKIDYGTEGYVLTPEERKKMRKEGRAILKAILREEPEFLQEIFKDDNGRK